MQNSNPIEFLQNTDSDYLNTVHLRNKRLNYFFLQVWFSKCVLFNKNYSEILLENNYSDSSI